MKPILIETINIVLSKHGRHDNVVINEGTMIRDDLGIDSLSFLETVIDLEKVIGIEVEVDALYSIVTVGELYNYVTSILNAR